jgi:hypothetical protein
LTVTGHGAAKTLINGNNASPIFFIADGAGKTTLQKLTVTGGRTTGGHGSAPLNDGVNVTQAEPF